MIFSSVHFGSKQSLVVTVSHDDNFKDDHDYVEEDNDDYDEEDDEEDEHIITQRWCQIIWRGKIPYI